MNIRINTAQSFWTGIALALLGGCSTNFEPKPLPADHPANVQAQEAPRSQTKRLIVTDELSRKTEMQLARKDLPNPDFQDSGVSHDMSKMPGMDHSKMQTMPPPAASATASPPGKEAVDGEMKKTSDEMKKLSDEMKAKSDARSQEQPSPSPQVQTQPREPAPSNQPRSKAIYTCVMHPEVQSDKPGKCPKCGMTLVKKQAGAK